MLMVKVSIPGSFIRGWSGSGGVRPSIKKSVSFVRTAKAWRGWVPRFASRVAGVGGGYLGAAAVVAGLGYDAYSSMARRRAKSRVGTRVRSGRIRKYAGPRRRTVARRRFVGRRPVMRKRTAANVFPSGAQGYMARAVKRRKISRPAYSGSGHEITFSKKVQWRVGRARPMDKRTLKLGFFNRILRWQRVNTMNSGAANPGALIMGHYTNGTSTVVPGRVVCLNSTMNNGSTCSPCYWIQFDDTGNPVFSADPGQDKAGLLTDSYWQYEFSPDEANPNQMNRYVMSAWYDIRLNCYGAKAQPTLYDISVVSFTKDFYSPLVGATGADADDRRALWQSLFHSFMSNPIMPAFKLKKFGMKVHKKYKFVIQPTLSIENDSTANNRVVRFFIRDGQLYDYTKHAIGFTGAGADDKLSTVQWQPQGAETGTVTSDFPHPRAQKWLLIRAMNTTRTSDNNANYTPSFDMIVRKKEYMQVE